MRSLVLDAMNGIVWLVLVLLVIFSWHSRLCNLRQEMDYALALTPNAVILTELVQLCPYFYNSGLIGILRVIRRTTFCMTESGIIVLVSVICR